MKLVLSILAWAAAAAAQAAALTDGSTGAVQSLSGRFSVPQSLGTVRGANLFHSFTRFGVAPGETATFSTSDAAIRNVISRVTGGEPSLIDGGIKLDAAAGSAPAFWLVNPSGVVVGAGASFDLPGSLHLSTAPRLQMADGSTWDTGSSNGSSLSVAAPESFGFLSGQVAAALRWQGANLTLQPGSTLELAAGSVTVQGAKLNAPGGHVGVRSPGDVLVSQATLYSSSGPDAQAGSISIDAGTLTIDGHGTAALLGVESSVGQISAADAIDLRVAGALRLSGGAEVLTYNLSEQSAGRVQVSADSITADGQSQRVTGIGSYSLGAGAGSAIDIDATRVSLIGGGQFFAAALGSGNGGALNVRAGSMLLDGQGTFAFIGTQVLSGGSGSAGALDVRVQDQLSLAGGGQIVSDSVNSGRAGRLSVSAGAMLIDGQSGDLTTGLRSYGAGALLLDVAGSLQLLNNAAITSFSNAGIAPAALQVRARSITLDGGGHAAAQITSLSSNESDSAALSVQASERLVLTAGGQISSATLGSGAAGSVDVKAPVIELSGGGEFVTAISSTSLGRLGGNSGDVDIQASSLSVKASASIYADSRADGGNAGRVMVAADTIVIDGTGLATGIHSLAQGKFSNAGSVVIQAAQQMTVRDGGSIIAGTLGSGSPGVINITAPTLLIDGKGAPDTFTGIAGDVLTGLGAGAEVSVNANRLSIVNGASVSSATYTGSNAGSVRINADVLIVDGGDRSHATGISADSGGAGNAGSVLIKAREMTLSNEALVSTSTLDTGQGGAISIDAGSLTVDSAAGIVSVTAGPGAAGNIDLRVVNALVLRQGGALSANTGGEGAAGRISVSAGSFLATGSDAASGFKTQVISRARQGSGGQPGSITLNVRDTFELLDGAALSIANDAQVANPGAIATPTLRVQANRIVLNAGDITAAASVNANAGQIVLTSAGGIQLKGSSVRTSALDGDGGPITLTAGGLVLLKDSRITSSVDGLSNGNGGDITITSPALVLASGFVQANTTAPLARGGQVQINAGLLLPDGNNVFVGGSRIETFRSGVPGYNVIQAAAPDGVSGQLSVTLPQLDLSAGLVSLSTRRLDLGVVARDVCEVGPDSRLSIQGRGALREPASAPLRLQP
ncbi:MAG: filamentous hemagglutinin N-terminal domain-containing protein [Rubrivivax sp.]|nr:filamentous hemagglutinin N-terminal domain-containing protein [Rubrivivax sp.]